jgi:pyridoxamine 5'-phosphate oxidase
VDLAQLRQEYSDAGLAETELAADPIEQFGRWYAAWREVAVGEPEAMVVASATPDGRPSVRTVLLRYLDADGFVFFSNRDSRKGREIAANPRVALVFSWHPVGRQVIIEGPAAQIDEAASDAYWATRPRGSQLASAVSPQSQVIPDRQTLERRFDSLEREYEGRDLPRPANWGGIRVSAERLEFWQGRERRMHDRLVYRHDDAAPGGWRVERLAP